MKNRWWLIVLAVFAVTACHERPTGPEAGDLVLEPTVAKVEKKPPPPSPDILLEVVFEDGTNGIRSDGLGSYVHGMDFVSAVIRDIGMLYFQAFAGKKRYDPARWVRVIVDESSMVVHESDHLIAFQLALEEAGDSWPDFTSDVTLHTRKTDDGMYSMAEKSTLLDAGKIGFKDYGNGDVWEWRLLFGARIETPEGGVDHYEDGLCITHPDAETWHVMTDRTECGGGAAGVDHVTQLWRVQRGVFTHVADFNTPMHLTLTGRQED
jgi:hypothetical protein